MTIANNRLAVVYMSFPVKVTIYNVCFMFKAHVKIASKLLTHLLSGDASSLI